MGVRVAEVGGVPGEAELGVGVRSGRRRGDSSGWHVGFVGPGSGAGTGVGEDVRQVEVPQADVDDACVWGGTRGEFLPKHWDE